MKTVFYFYQQTWKLLYLSVATGLIGGLSGAAMIAVLGGSIGLEAHLPAHAAMFFGLGLLSLGSRCCSEITLLHMTQSAVTRLRLSLSRKILSAPLKDLQKIGKSGLLVLLTSDIDTFSQASSLFSVIFTNLVVIVSSLIYLAWLSWTVFLAFACCLCGCLTLFLLAERRPARHMGEVRTQLEFIYRNFRGLIDGAKELQLNAERGASYLDHVVTPNVLQFRAHFLRSMIGYAVLLNGGAVSFYLVIGTLLFGAPLYLPHQAGVLTSITIILLFLVQPIIAVVMAMPNLRQADIALKRIQILDKELRPAEPASDGTDPFAVRTPFVLELCGVCHSVFAVNEDERFALGPIDLTVRQGEILYITGGNGGGKTTLAMLVLGLYIPERGSLRLNGVDVTDANIEAYRTYFSAIFSDFHLFDQLPLGGSAFELERAMHYIDLLGMGGKVSLINGRFSTTNLSTGQRKRLALVSSYLEDRQIYLFDEWACDQDPQFKRIFYTQLLPELKARGKTVLAITHDDSYFGCADRIVRIDDGKLGHDGDTPRHSLFRHSGLDGSGEETRSAVPDARNHVNRISGRL